MSYKLLLLCRLSLSFLWILTGLTSALFSPETGFHILAGAGIEGTLADICVYGGSLLDISIGIWLLTPFKQQLCYLVQVVVIVVFTVLLTLIAPEFWLHPFGPVTKNLPIIALLVVLYQSRSD